MASSSLPSSSLSSTAAVLAVSVATAAAGDEQLESLVARALTQQRLKPWQVDRWVIGVGDWARKSTTSTTSSSSSSKNTNSNDDSGIDENARGSGGQFLETFLPTLTSAMPPDRLAAAVRALRLETALLCSNIVGVLVVGDGSSGAARTLSATLAAELAKDGTVRSDTRVQKEVEYWVVVDAADAARELRCMVLELAARLDRPHRRGRL